MNVQTVPGASTSELALRSVALRGTAVYMACIATSGEIDRVLEELGDEIVALEPGVEIATLRPRAGDSLVDELGRTAAELILVDARAFAASDWALLDRRRSSLAHRGVLVFATTSSSFDELMRSAPNLASWLGAQVFAHEPEGAGLEAARLQRLEALRAWAARSDADVIRAAEEGTLSRDPEYGEWLVLLGRGDLLGPREP